MKLEFEQVGDIWKSFSSQHIVDCIFLSYKIEKVGNKYLAKVMFYEEDAPHEESLFSSFREAVDWCQQREDSF